MHTLIKSIIPILLLTLCISCGQTGGNIGFGPPEREIEKLYNSADGTYNDLLAGKIKSSPRNWEIVIGQFQNIVKDYPKSRFADDAQHKVGLCYINTYGYMKDSPENAVKAFNRLIKYYPDSEFVDDAYYWKAYAHLLNEDYITALSGFQEFTKNYPASEFKEKAVEQIEECNTNLSKQKGMQIVKEPPAKEQVPEPPPIVTKKADEKPLKKPEPQAEIKVDAKVEEIVIVQPEPPAQQETPAEVTTEELPPQEPEVESGECAIVENVRFYSSQEYTRVVLDLTAPVKYETGQLEDPPRIYVDIRAASLTPAKRELEPDDYVIKTIRCAQYNERTVRLVLDTKEIKGYKIFCLKERDRLVVDVFAPGSSEDFPLNSLPSDQLQTMPLVKQLGLKVKTIVIDPGHGGKDPGAVSKSGVLEKDIVLDVSKRLKALLESNGDYEVHLTRKSDIYIPLEERTAFANRKQADIFISIHVNAFKDRKAHGIETYYLSLASDEEAKLTAALENASADKTIEDLSGLLNNILRGTKVKESRELARIIQSRLCKHAGNTDRGVKRAPFIVLIGAKAPSVLAELGFISNASDEDLLEDEEYREKLARALMEAIKDYIGIIDQAFDTSEDDTSNLSATTPLDWYNE